MAESTNYYHHGYIAVPTDDGAEVHYLMPITSSNNVLTPSGDVLTDIITNIENSQQTISAISTSDIDKMWAGTYTAS